MRCPTPTPSIADGLSCSHDWRDQAANPGVAEKEMVSNFFSSCCLKEHVEVFHQFLKGVQKSVNKENVEHARQVRNAPTMEF